MYPSLEQFATAHDNLERAAIDAELAAESPITIDLRTPCLQDVPYCVTCNGQHALDAPHDDYPVLL